MSSLAAADLSLEQKRALLAELLQKKKSLTAPLSSIQRRFWFLDRLEANNFAYNICRAWRLSGSLDIAALERAVNELITRHDALRTTFPMVDGDPVQVVSTHDRVDLSVIDVSGTGFEQAIAEVKRRLSVETSWRFDLARGPLFRASLIRLDAAQHVFLINVHHIVCDGWSLGIIENELASLYQAFSAGDPPTLSELPIQYADYSRWQQGWLNSHEVQEEIAWWTEQLRGAPSVLELPVDRPRPPVQHMIGAHRSIAIDAALTARLRSLGRGEGATLFMTLLAAFELLLFKYTGQDDFLVGTPVAGRERTETQGVVGLFLNTLVLRGRLDGDPTFRELLQRVKRCARAAYAHQSVPFEKLVEELHPERDLSRSPLFQTMFTLQVPLKPFQLPGLETQEILPEVPTAKLDLTLFLAETDQGLSGEIEYNTDLFEAGTIERMEGHLRRLLEEVVAEPERRIGELEMLTAEERERMLVDWNATGREYSREASIHELIEQQVERTPEAEAVRFEGRAWSYRELNARANQVAHYLRGRGIGPDQLVGVLMERSAELMVALLGILKAGGAYVPLDPAYPSERVRYMLEDCGAQVVISEQRLAEGISGGRAQVICLDRDWSAIAECSRENARVETKPTHLAYVIYTSGSTGRPKGVMLEHGGVVNFLESMRREPGMSGEDTLLAVTTASFDIAGLELYLPLISGARVEIASRETALDGRRLAAQLESSGATVMQATPATWRMLIESGWSGDGRLKVLCGGEALPAELGAELVKRGGSVWNLYGPTETTIWSTLQRVEGQESGVVGIGRPIANTRVYILDRQGRPTPVGVAGELYIGGEGVARGYWRRPELTAEKFVADEWGGGTTRLYRTGDLVRWRAEGTLEYLGRMDDQVKVRGHRIELGEIEAALAECAGVSQCVVAAREDQPGDVRLVAYLVAQPGAAPETAELRRRLRERLPEYMLASAFVFLDKLPLTPNGKVNRKALPAPAQMGPELGEIVPPDNRAERLLADIWQEVLGLPNISVTDNFFEIGGHSLLAVRLFTRIEQALGHNIPIATLFQAPTIRQLARTIQDKNWGGAWSPVVELQRHGGSAPFVCIHSQGTNLLSYKKLASRLGDQQFYGIQPHGLDGEQAPLASIPDMAAAYLREIRNVQPKGPYRIGGVCLGGVVAFEMAQQLAAGGEEIALLLMIDSEFPGQPEPFHIRPYSLFLADWHLGHLLRLRFGDKLSYLSRKFANLGRRIATAARGRGAKGSLETAIKRVSQANLVALLSYHPEPYAGKITFFWSAETPARCYEDKRLAWSGVARDGFELHVIPGDHMTMIEDPHVTVMAEKMRACLARAAATFPGERRLKAAAS